MRKTFSILAVVLWAIGCGGVATDHTATLTRLRTAITEEVATRETLEDHNTLVENVVQSGALEGLRQFELQERVGRGDECGIRDLCQDRGFRPNDWFYEVGHAPGDPDLPAGPTLIVGFDSTGIVDRTFYVTRRYESSAPPAATSGDEATDESL